MGRESAPAPAGDSDVPVPVRDKIPLRLWLAMAAGMMERAVYYGSMIMIRWWAPEADNEWKRMISR